MQTNQKLGVEVTVRSPLMDLLQEGRTLRDRATGEKSREVTLDDWLSAAGCVNEFDGEIEVPEEFEQEYLKRCQMNCEYERKFEARRKNVRP